VSEYHSPLHSSEQNFPSRRSLRCSCSHVRQTIGYLVRFPYSRFQCIEHRPRATWLRSQSSTEQVRSAMSNLSSGTATTPASYSSRGVTLLSWEGRSASRGREVARRALRSAVDAPVVVVVTELPERRVDRLTTAPAVEVLAGVHASLVGVTQLAVALAVPSSGTAASRLVPCSLVVVAPRGPGQHRAARLEADPHGHRFGLQHIKAKLGTTHCRPHVWQRYSSTPTRQPRRS
jgi:hypothetical protein